MVKLYILNVIFIQLRIVGKSMFDSIIVISNFKNPIFDYIEKLAFVEKKLDKGEDPGEFWSYPTKSIL